MFSYLSPEQRVPSDHPLRAIRQITDTVLEQLSQLFSGMYAKVGRRSIPPEDLAVSPFVEHRLRIGRHDDGSVLD
jgi:hypothetical protein